MVCTLCAIKFNGNPVSACRKYFFISADLGDWLMGVRTKAVDKQKYRLRLVLPVFYMCVYLSFGRDVNCFNYRFLSFVFCAYDGISRQCQHVESHSHHLSSHLSIGSWGFVPSMIKVFFGQPAQFRRLNFPPSQRRNGQKPSRVPPGPCPCASCSLS